MSKDAVLWPGRLASIPPTAAEASRRPSLYVHTRSQGLRRRPYVSGIDAVHLGREVQQPLLLERARARLEEALGVLHLPDLQAARKAFGKELPRQLHAINALDNYPAVSASHPFSLPSS